MAWKWKIVYDLQKDELIVCSWWVMIVLLEQVRVQLGCCYKVDLDSRHRQSLCTIMSAIIEVYTPRLDNSPAFHLATISESKRLPSAL